MSKAILNHEPTSYAEYCRHNRTLPADNMVVTLCGLRTEQVRIPHECGWELNVGDREHTYTPYLKVDCPMCVLLVLEQEARKAEARK